MRVVIPFVPGRLHRLTKAWGESRQAEFCDVSADGEAYFRLLKQLWADRRAFMVVEQDIVPPARAVEDLAACPRPWCGCPYQYGGGDVVLAGHLGCTRFAARLLREHPRLVEDSARESLVIDNTGGQDYEYLSLRLFSALWRAGKEFHDHGLEAVHHRQPDEIHSQNIRELLAALSTASRYRLEADLARRFGDRAAALRAEWLGREAGRLIAGMTRRLTPEDLAAMPEALRTAVAAARGSRQAPQ